MDDLTPVAKRQKRIKNFTAGEKRELIKAVEEWPQIWDKTNVMHSNKNAVEQAWVHISNSVGKTVSECKAGWISLRKSCRYHAKVARKYKSGSAGGETLEEPFFQTRLIGILLKKWHFYQIHHTKEQLSQVQRLKILIQLPR
ncbi:uncharacterized protein LOC120781711 isoform X1 [Bactrocera tryoni]|uniref:uncharacterized protein LOC120781711 isoform X1 n=1 Tax=Bactrocera tryoni TaxID=59916 RepID=UPI001A95C5D0|nr:uncharacterized protein LOC120781711 isoform X1 [Bactrocera tryoni]